MVMFTPFLAAHISTVYVAMLHHIKDNQLGGGVGGEPWYLLWEKH